MPKIPAPFTNCLRFHYGVCRERPKQCFRCGDFNHIERYCPHNRCIQVYPGEPLPGTRVWCDKYALNNDPELKQKILNTIKASPGCAIWLNNVCIYGAKQVHFPSDNVSRGRLLDDGTTRRRSRSPLGRNRRRSHSPFRGGHSSKTDQFGYDLTPHHGRSTSSYRQRRTFRSRSPLRRRSPSPNRLSSFKSPPPRYSRDSPVLNYDHNDNSQRNFRHENNCRKSRSLTAPRPLTRLPLFSFEQESRVPLSNIINTHNAARTVKDGPTKILPTPPTSNGSMHGQSTCHLEKAGSIEDLHVDDPYFILGIMEGAAEQE